MSVGALEQWTLVVVKARPAEAKAKWPGVWYRVPLL